MRHTIKPRPALSARPVAPIAAGATLTLLLAACATDDPTTPSAPEPAGSMTSGPAAPDTEASATTEPAADDHDHHDDDHDDHHDHDDHDDDHGGHDDHGDDDAATAAPDDDAREVRETAGASPRLGVTYDGGVMVLDAMTLEVLADLPAEGFLRLNPAGDDRHLLLSEGSSFRVLDAGVWSEPHGDHDHSYATDPVLTDIRFGADKPAHVVHHAGRTVLFDDGTGEMTVFDPADLADGELPEVEQMSAEDAHHGVAVRLEDGSTFFTLGDEESRSGAVVVDADGTEVARNEECPGVHGETVAAGGTVVVGCEDGVLLFADGEFTKVDAEEEYARIGNVAGEVNSPVVLGDYKTDPDADLERPTTVALVDTRSAQISLVELPASYTFRSLGRDAAGDALVLGTDGVLRTIGVETGEIVAETAVTGPWEEPTDWQQPRPTLLVMGELAYVSEPAHQELHIVDLRTDTVIDTVELPQVPNELSGVTG